ncbi:hypothetical protein RhiXN_10835 [Rhizoctonia solani]|uniref:Uncharacterized protein n=1 Tax=Rhizoctonia solani TaxID=456999 RepID=A0A8H8P6S1_9AGAM|nr:uncharacterized protein RhiXN_10835 [Rhizoctonia solani]QRW25758.1 hypothetical protein RhiXN_10835 [Rhizoctonia solani]
MKQLRDTQSVPSTKGNQYNAHIYKHAHLSTLLRGQKPTGTPSLIELVMAFVKLRARVSLYKRHRTQGGARRREWREKWRNEKAKEQGKENRDTKGDGEEKQTNAYRKSTEETSGPSSGHGNNKVDGGVTGTVPNIPKRENYTCPIHANKTKEVINNKDWDWDQFANSEAN